jgi:hypothetical protein
MPKRKYEQWLEPEGLALLGGWARDGLTDEQIAHNIGISRSTLKVWKNKFPAISATLKAGKEVVDRMVENSLIKRALGMTVSNITYKMVPVKDDVLKAHRTRFLNEYRLEHPDLTLKELKLIATEQVPTYERIPIIEQKNELAPSEAAAMFWLKNRKPKQYRDQTFADLNAAQTAKAKVEAELARMQVEAATKDEEDDGATYEIAWSEDEEVPDDEASTSQSGAED